MGAAAAGAGGGGGSRGKGRVEAETETVGIVGAASVLEYRKAEELARKEKRTNDERRARGAFE